jgi:hypothetical protein
LKAILYGDVLDNTNIKVYLVFDNKDTYQVKKATGKHRPFLMIDIMENVSVTLPDLDLLPRIQTYFGSKFFKRDVQIISFFDEIADRRTVSALRPASFGIISPGNLSNRVALLAAVAKARGKFLIVVGHIEGDAIVMRNARGSVTDKVELTELTEAAIHHQVALIVLGCEAGQIGGVTGLVDKTSSITVATQIRKALAASDNGSFFNSLGQAGNCLIVYDTVVRPTGMIVMARTEMNYKLADFTSGLRPYGAGSWTVMLQDQSCNENSQEQVCNDEQNEDLAIEDLSKQKVEVKNHILIYTMIVFALIGIYFIPEDSFYSLKKATAEALNSPSVKHASIVVFIGPLLIATMIFFSALYYIWAPLHWAVRWCRVLIPYRR